LSFFQCCCKQTLIVIVLLVSKSLFVDQSDLMYVCVRVRVCMFLCKTVCADVHLCICIYLYCTYDAPQYVTQNYKWRWTKIIYLNSRCEHQWNWISDLRSNQLELIQFLRHVRVYLLHKWLCTSYVHRNMLILVNKFLISWSVDVCFVMVWFEVGVKFLH